MATRVMFTGPRAPSYPITLDRDSSVGRLFTDPTTLRVSIVSKDGEERTYLRLLDDAAANSRRNNPGEVFRQLAQQGIIPADWVHRLGPSPERATLRSITPPGFARAFFEANP